MPMLSASDHRDATESEKRRTQRSVTCTLRRALGRAVVWTVTIAVLFSHALPAFALPFAEFTQSGPPPAAGGSATTGNAHDAYLAMTTWWLENKDSFSDAEQELLGNPIDTMPSEAARAALAKMAPFADRMREAGVMGSYDAKLDRTQGFSVSLPHLATLRRATRTLALSARFKMLDGDVASAIKDLEAISGFSRQVRDDGLAISSLVSAAMLHLNDRVLNEVVGLGVLSPDQAGALADAIAPMRGPDGLRVADAISGELEFARFALKDTLERGPPGVAELLSLTSSGDEGVDPTSVTPDTIEKEWPKLEAVYTSMAAAIANPDRDAARAEIAAIEARIQAGDEGILAKILVPSVLQMAETMWKTSDLVEARFKQLDDIRSGRVTAAAAANAAFAYLRAAALVERLPDEQQALIETARVAQRELDEATVAATRQVIRPIRKALRECFVEAAGRKNCDLNVSRVGRPALLMSYLGGIRAAMRVAMSDALIASARAADTTAAGATADAAVPPFSVEEVVDAGLRLTKHLALDPAIGHALLSTSILSEVAAFAKESRLSGRLDQAAVERLRGLLDAMPSIDPTEVAKASQADRTRLVDRVGDAPLRDRYKRPLESLLFVQYFDQSRQGLPANQEREILERWRSRAPLTSAGDLVGRAALDEFCESMERYHGELLAAIEAKREQPEPSFLNSMKSDMVSVPTRATATAVDALVVLREELTLAADAVQSLPKATSTP